MNYQIEERAYEDALIKIRTATDSRGLRIVLGPRGVPDSRGWRNAVADFAKELDHHTVFINTAGTFGSPATPDSPTQRQGEQAYARNLRLMVEAWEACVAYEQAKARTPE